MSGIVGVAEPHVPELGKLKRKYFSETLAVTRVTGYKGGTESPDGKVRTGREGSDPRPEDSQHGRQAPTRSAPHWQKRCAPATLHRLIRLPAAANRRGETTTHLARLVTCVRVRGRQHAPVSGARCRPLRCAATWFRCGLGHRSGTGARVVSTRARTSPGSTTERSQPPKGTALRWRPSPATGPGRSAAGGVGDRAGFGGAGFHGLAAQHDPLGQGLGVAGREPRRQLPVLTPAP